MVIQHNIPAINAHRNLGINNSATAKNLEKLSSGFKINRAGDDAAGLAISEKMRGQIRGLAMAEQNASNGISLIQTAEGGLNETHAILQRMRELAVQSVNGTYQEEDRKLIELEFQALKSEIDRIASYTAYNGIKLLDGTTGGVLLQHATTYGMEILGADAMELMGAGLQTLLGNVSLSGENLFESMTFNNTAVYDGTNEDTTVDGQGYAEMFGVTFGTAANPVVANGTANVTYNGSITSGIEDDTYTITGTVRNGQVEWKMRGTNPANVYDLVATGTGFTVLNSDGNAIAEITATAMDGAVDDRLANGTTINLGSFASSTNTTTGVITTSAGTLWSATAITSGSRSGSVADTGTLDITLKYDGSDWTVKMNKAFGDLMVISIAGDQVITVESEDGTSSLTIDLGAPLNPDADMLNGELKLSLDLTGVSVYGGATAVTDNIDLSQPATTSARVFMPHDDAATKAQSIENMRATHMLMAMGLQVDSELELLGDFVDKFNGEDAYILTRMGKDGAPEIIFQVGDEIFLGYEEANGDITFKFDEHGDGTSIIEVATLTNVDMTAITEFGSIRFNIGDVNDVNSVTGDPNFTRALIGKEGAIIATENQAELIFQIGANGAADQKVGMYVYNMSSANLGNHEKGLFVADASIANASDANTAIETLDAAINYVSAQRANLGALQNRLEHTLNNLGVTKENLTAAESTIRDVDMAKEMMEFTKNNILVQAAQAMLAQANQLPQGVLQLLR